MKRALTQQEKELTSRNLETHKKELGQLEYFRKLCELQISEGLKVDYEIKMQQIKAQLSENLKNIETKKVLITMIEDQIVNGVEIKTNKKVK